MKDNRRKRAAFLVLLMMLLFLCSCSAQPSQGICYRITGGRNSMVILGSIHVGNKQMEPYGEHILHEMQQADVFVFECDNEDPAALQAAQDLMFLESGTLADVLLPECYGLVSRVCRQENFAMTVMDQMKPWAVSSVLTTDAAAGQLGVRNAQKAMEYGVENTVLRYAEGKELCYLETAEQQLLLMDGMSMPLQQEMLWQTCTTILDPQAAKNSTLSSWPKWWHDGDAEAFARDYALEDDAMDPLLAEEYHSAFVTGRNRQMADGLLDLLENEESHRYFVTVGLMHLVLPRDSILWELEQRGYTVERLWLEENP